MITDLVHWFGDPAHWSGPDGIPQRLLEHLGYTALSLVIALVIAVPLGLFVGHTGRGGVALVSAGNAIRALPTLGLVTFLFLLFTESVTSTIIGLVVLAVPPILAGTYAGLQATDHGVVDAAEGDRDDRLAAAVAGRGADLPAARARRHPQRRARSSSATAAVAAYVGLGGLGRFLLDGLAILDYSEVIAGALLTTVLAIVLDLLFAALNRALVPRGVRLAAAVKKVAA